MTNKEVHDRIEAREMKYLRNHIVEDELKASSTLLFIREGQLEWFGHLSKINNDREIKEVWTAKEGRQMKPGGLQKSLNDVVNQATPGSDLVRGNENSTK